MDAAIHLMLSVNTWVSEGASKVAEHVVREAAGWAGLADALTGAQPGDLVRIGAGKFSGSDTIYVPSGVTVEGSADTFLEFTGEEVAIAVHNAQDVRLRGFELEGYGQFPLHLDEPDREATWLNGLVQIVDSHNIDLETIAVTALSRRRCCISAVTSEDVTVTGCTVRGARRGVGLWAATGRIENSTAEKCMNGIALAQHCEFQSRAEIIGNRCSDKMQSGIILFSSESNAVEANVANKRHDTAQFKAGTGGRVRAGEQGCSGGCTDHTSHTQVAIDFHD